MEKDGTYGKIKANRNEMQLDPSIIGSINIDKSRQKRSMAIKRTFGCEP